MKTVKYAVSVILFSLLVSPAFAQGGALCGTFDRELMVQVSPDHSLSLIDPTAPQDQQVLIQFTQVDTRPTRVGSLYEANIRGAIIPHPEKYVAGARLTELQWVTLAVNSASVNLVQANGIVPGSLKLQKANGQTLQKLLTCTMDSNALLHLQ